MMRALVLEAIRKIRDHVVWKPGKGREHLETRIGFGHLPKKATLADYEAIISTVVRDPKAEAFVYTWLRTGAVYPTIVAPVGGVTWLVMVDRDGTMETAFPPRRPGTYLSDPTFTRLGTLEELEP